MSAPAKVNLYLGIGGVRADGYHALVSVFHALELADEITIETAETLSLHCDRELGVAPEANLAYRAALAMGEAFGRTPAVRIGLVKRIPHGAGLGGGSSDAAAVIAGLTHLWGVAAEDPRRTAVAASLGADVPFFLADGAALMAGRGDELVHALPPMNEPVLLVRPSQPVPTAEAYRVFDADPKPPGDPQGVIGALEVRDPIGLADSLSNNMETAACAIVAEVAEALAWARHAPGVRGAIVAGSGSAVFALCESEASSRELAVEAATRGWWSCATRLGSRGVTVTSEG